MEKIEFLYEILILFSKLGGNMNYLIEKSINLDEYQWTAKRYETIGDFSLGDLVLNFIIPSVKLIRHSDNRYAERWYWSWKKESNTNLFCRLYFLAKTENHKNIWELVEEIRKNEVSNIIKSGIEEQVIKNLTDEMLERGITIEHASEMSLIIWTGSSLNTDISYRKTFHHFFESLLISDNKALEILQNSIGLGIFK